MESMNHKKRLAGRLGTTWHVSPLRMKLAGLMPAYPTGAQTVDDWLIDMANLRGARVLTRPGTELCRSEPPGEDVLSSEELIVGICLAGNEDRLQTLRLAAQLITRGNCDTAKLIRLIRMERVEPVIGSLARAVLHVQPQHAQWSELARVFGKQAARVPLLHWTRLAEPVPNSRHVASGAWRLVA
jgi:hypothetical protein